MQAYRWNARAPDLINSAPGRSKPARPRLKSSTAAANLAALSGSARSPKDSPVSTGGDLRS